MSMSDNNELKIKFPKHKPGEEIRWGKIVGFKIEYEDPESKEKTDEHRPPE